MPGLDRDRKLLGVTEDAGVEEITAAFRRLAKKHHPDISKSPGAAKRFVQIEKAYRRLLTLAHQRRLAGEHLPPAGYRDTKGGMPPDELARAAMNRGEWPGDSKPASSVRLSTWRSSGSQRIATTGLALVLIVLSMLGLSLAVMGGTSVQSAGTWVDKNGKKRLDKEKYDRDIQQAGYECLSGGVIIFATGTALTLRLCKRGLPGLFDS